MGRFKRLFKTAIEKRPAIVIGFSLVSFVLIFILQWVSVNPNYGGDWHYVYPEHITEELRLPQIWEQSENLGQNSASRVSLSLLDLAQAGIYRVSGMEFTATEIILWFLPFLFGAYLSSYLLSIKLFKSRFAAAISALFYTLNSYTLVLFAEAGHINILVAYAFVPLLLLTLLRLIDKRSYVNSLLFSLSLTLVFVFDLRIGVISLIILGITLLFKLAHARTKTNRLRIIKWVFLGFIQFLIINAFWILPLLFTPQTQLLGNGQSNPDWVGRLSFQTVEHGLFPGHPFWSNSGISYFSVNDLNPLFYLFTFIILIGFLAKQKKNLKTYIFLGAIWLTGIFLLKGANEPFGEVYIWLFENLPGFKMFREPQKFYVLAMLPIALLFGAALDSIHHRLDTLGIKNAWRVKLLSILLFMFVFAVSLFPAYSLQLEGNLKSRPLPDYANAVEKLLKDDVEFSRTLWIPQVTSSAYRSDLHPRVDANISLSEILGLEEFTPQAVSRFLTSSNFDYFLDKASIRYVIFPNDQETLRWYRIGFEDIALSLKENPRLEVISDNGFLIFENKDYSPLIYAHNNTILTNYQLGDTNLGIDSFLDDGSVVFTNPEMTIPDALTANADTYVNLSKTDQLADFKEGRLEMISNIPENDLFSLTDFDTAKYFQVSFNQVAGNRYQLQLTHYKEDLQIEDRRLSLNSSRFGTKTDVLMEEGAFYAVDIAGRKLYFNFDEISAGVAKGPVYLADGKPKKIEVYKSNTEKYLDEAFNEKAELDVGDCNNFDNTTMKQNSISYSFSSDANEGKSALLLKAGNHIGCYTKAFFPAEPDSFAKISIAYKNITGSPPEVCLFDHERDECVIRSSFADSANETWKHRDIELKLNEKSDKYNIYLYANATEGATSNLYDSIVIRGYRLLDRLELMTQSAREADSESFFLRSGDRRVSYHSKLVSKVDVFNSSFEEPVNYQSAAKDCNNADETGLETNGIRVTQTEDSTDKRSALRVSGERHVACYNLKLGELSGDFLYLISFDYRSQPDSFSKYCIFNAATGSCDHQGNLDPDTNWKNQLITFDPASSSDFELYLSSYSRLGDDNSFYSEFDKVKVFRIPRNLYSRFMLISNSGRELTAEIPRIKYTVINPTKILIKVKDANEPYYLNFSGSFNGQWSLSELASGIDHSDPVETLLRTINASNLDADHFKSDGFSNSWLVDKTGSYTLLLEYKGQTLLTAGLGFSGLSTIVMVVTAAGILLINRHKKGRNEAKRR
ncbi:MAG: hypothetical protein ACE5DX_05880 [Candidatus Dojkabacteria bacterium]